MLTYTYVPTTYVLRIYNIYLGITGNHNSAYFRTINCRKIYLGTVIG